MNVKCTMIFKSQSTWNSRCFFAYFEMNGKFWMLFLLTVKWTWNARWFQNSLQITWLNRMHRSPSGKTLIQQAWVQPSFQTSKCDEVSWKALLRFLWIYRQGGVCFTTNFSTATLRVVSTACSLTSSSHVDKRDTCSRNRLEWSFAILDKFCSSFVRLRLAPQDSKDFGPQLPNTWLILPAVICSDKRLSHACLRISLWLNLRTAH